MSKELSATCLNKGIEVKTTHIGNAEDDHLGNAFRKIARIAACINLHELRGVIDEVVNQIEAENEKASLLETALQEALPLSLSMIIETAPPPRSAQAGYA